MAKWKYTLLPNSRLLKFCLWYFIYDIKLLKFKYVSTFWPAFFLKKDYSWLAESFSQPGITSTSQQLLQPLNQTKYFKVFVFVFEDLPNEDPESFSHTIRFQKITWDTKFFSSDVRKMEKGT